MVKVFISHQLRDAIISKRVAAHLAAHGIASYLDVIDSQLNRPVEDLADHIRNEMGACTQLLAIVSEATQASQWVPWEIGVASEKEFPLATFATPGVTPPEFLRKWPYLQSFRDLDDYATASKSSERVFVTEQRFSVPISRARRTATRAFYSTLRKSLGQ